MDSARQRRRRWAAGLGVSLAFNGGLLSLVAFQTATIRSTPPPGDQRTLTAVLVRLPEAIRSPPRAIRPADASRAPAPAAPRASPALTGPPAPVAAPVAAPAAAAAPP